MDGNSDFLSGVSRLAELVSNIKLDPKDYEGQVIDDELVKWYDDRFNMFVEDGMRSCITAYMGRAQREDTNQLTKLVILHLGLNK